MTNRQSLTVSSLSASSCGFKDTRLRGCRKSLGMRRARKCRQKRNGLGADLTTGGDLNQVIPNLVMTAVFGPARGCRTDFRVLDVDIRSAFDEQLDHAAMTIQSRIVHPRACVIETVRDCIDLRAFM